MLHLWYQSNGRLDLARLLINLFPVVFDMCVKHHRYLCVFKSLICMREFETSGGEAFASLSCSVVEHWFIVLLTSKVWI